MDVFDAIEENDAERVTKMAKEDPGVLAVQTKTKLSPLMYALLRCKYNMVVLLLDLGADPNQLVAGKTALVHCMYEEQAKLLIGRGADPNIGYPLSRVALLYPHRTEIAKLLLENGAKVNPDATESPLFRAVFANNLPVAKLLVEHGADMHFEGKSALHLAAVNCYPPMCDFLMDKGLDPNELDVNGASALDHARLHRNVHNEKCMQDRLALGVAQ